MKYVSMNILVFPQRLINGKISQDFEVLWQFPHVIGTIDEMGIYALTTG